MAQICLIVDFTLKPGVRERFLTIMLDHAAKTLAEEEGCLRFDVAVARDQPDRVCLYEVYRDEAAFTLHRESALLARTRAAYQDLIADRMIIPCEILPAGVAA